MWSEWRNVTQPANYDGPAVYRVRLCNLGTAITIKRFLGSDDGGLLCIGKSKDMENRRRAFLSGLATESGHSEGNLLHILEKVTSLKAIYPEREYEYSFQIVRSGNEDIAEEELIKAYVKQFGEVPPLNSAIPKRYNDWKL